MRSVITHRLKHKSANLGINQRLLVMDNDIIEWGTHTKQNVALNSCSERDCISCNEWRGDLLRHSC